MFNFNATLDSLRALVASVRERSDAIRQGSTEIAKGSGNLARRSEMNAACVEETTASIVELERSLSAITDAARDTVKRADGAITSVGSGRQAAGEAVEKMYRVHESADRLSDRGRRQNRVPDARPGNERCRRGAPVKRAAALPCCLPRFSAGNALRGGGQECARTTERYPGRN